MSDNHTLTMSTTTQELSAYADKLLFPPEFLGVFSKDQLPKTVGPFHKTSLIINLNTSNLPGTHWVAIYARNNEAYYFDPLAYQPPQSIVTWLSNNFKQWKASTRQVQPTNSAYCGYFCLHFLFLAKLAYFTHRPIELIIDEIYPKAWHFGHYQDIVISFINSQLLTSDHSHM